MLLLGRLRIFWKLGLCCILMMWALPAFALQAVLQSRSPLCDLPKKNCQPLFFLQNKEQVQVLYRQGKDWFKVQHLTSQRTGWVAAEDVSLVLPTSLKRQQKQDITDALGLFRGQPLGVFSASEVYGVDSDVKNAMPRTAFQAGIRFKADEQVAAMSVLSGQLPLFHLLQTQEQRSVLFSLAPFLKIPQYLTLAHFDRAEDFAGSAVRDSLTLIAGKARGPWGDSVLVALDDSLWPVWIYRDLRELWVMLPLNLQGELRSESFQMLGLSPEGYLLVSAYNQKLAKKVIVYWRYETEWVFQNMLQWPTELEVEQVKHWFVAANSEALVLAVNREKDAQLFLFPAGLSEVALYQPLLKPLLDMTWSEQDLWVLDADSLTRWKPLYTKAE